MKNNYDFYKNNNQLNTYFNILNKPTKTEIYSHKFKQLIFNNDFDSNFNNKTILNINLIETFNYELNSTYYEAEYNFINFINSKENKDIVPSCHPFYNISETKFKKYSIGILVIKNELTEQLIRYLFMDNNILQKKIGNSTVQSYRINILNLLAQLCE